MLRVAFDTSFASPMATYEVPFGALARPNDGREFPALKWADMGEQGYGVSILNDSKHGYSASGNTMRLSLIRSSYDPDPVPNPGQHHWRYAILPHSGALSTYAAGNKADDLNQPLLAATVPFDARGTAPLDFAPFEVPAGVTVTGLKLAEKDRDFVVRMFANGSNVLAAATSLGCKVNVTGATWVNFLEDALGSANVGSGGKIPLALHPWEIRRVKIKIKIGKASCRERV